MGLHKGQKINRKKGYHLGVRREEIAMFGTAAFILRRRISDETKAKLSVKAHAREQRKREAREQAARQPVIE